MFSPGEIWSMIGGGAVVVFGAGQLVEKMRNGKYVAKDMCFQKHERVEETLKRMEKNLERIWRRVDDGREAIE